MSFAWDALKQLAMLAILAVIIGGVFGAGCALGVFCQ